jgi:hypothetical protein
VQIAIFYICILLKFLKIDKRTWFKRTDYNIGKEKVLYYFTKKHYIIPDLTSYSQYEKMMMNSKQIRIEYYVDESHYKKSDRPHKRYKDVFFDDGKKSKQHISGWILVVLYRRKRRK